MHNDSINSSLYSNKDYSAPLKRVLVIFSLLPLLLIVAGTANADFSDTFTAPDGTDLQTYNSNYNPDTHPVTIQNNSISPNGTTVYVSNNEFVDGCISMDWTGNTSNTNMSVRNIGNNNSQFYGFIHFNTNWLLYRNDASNIIDSGNLDFSGTHNYKLCAIGSRISVSKNGTEFANGVDTVITGSGGQAFYSEGNTMDNLSITVGNNPQPVTTTFSASGDTYVRSGQSNRNEGGAPFMQLQSSGDNRGLVKFDQQALASAVGSGEVLSAKLRLTITDNGNNWGTTGRTVDVHRLITSWDEGNGTAISRGSGNGATWSCATDSAIQNQAKDCSATTEWEMGQPNNPAVHPWIQSATATQTITNNQSGIVEYDVTSDLASFVNGTNTNYGWIVKKTNEGQNGQVSFGTKESTVVPQLVVTYQP
jgi:hypothetical protein